MAVAVREARRERTLRDVLAEMQATLDLAARELAEIRRERVRRERQREMYRESVRRSVCAHGVLVSEVCEACDQEITSSAGRILAWR